MEIQKTFPQGHVKSTDGEKTLIVQPSWPIRSLKKLSVGYNNNEAEEVTLKSTDSFYTLWHRDNNGQQHLLFYQHSDRVTAYV